MDGHEFGRRLGLDWDTELYMKLIEFVVDNKCLFKDEVAIQNMSVKDVKELSKHIYTKYGHHKQYKENVLFFLQSNYQNINDDCLSKYVLSLVIKLKIILHIFNIIIN